MKKLILSIALLLNTFFLSAQLGKTEVENMIKNVNMNEIKEIYLIRTRQHDGSQGWYEKFEKLDPKKCKITYNEKSMMLDGDSYSILIPYDKIKVIFTRKAEYFTIELLD